MKIYTLKLYVYVLKLILFIVIPKTFATFYFAHNHLQSYAVSSWGGVHSLSIFSPLISALSLEP